MNKDRSEEFEKAIRTEMDQLLGEMEGGKESTEPPESLDGTIGRLSRQDALMQQEIAKDAQRRRNERLHLLQQALGRVQDGSFGICLRCGQNIAKPRLLAYPEAALCVNCS